MLVPYLRQASAFALALALLLSSSPALADNDLHDKDNFQTDADSCAGCHRAHTARASSLLTIGPTQDLFCFSCHDGTGAETDVLNGELDGGTYGSSGSGLRGGGFLYATMDVDVNGNITSRPVTSTHTADGVSSGTIWGSGPINATPDYGTTVELACGDCHNPHGNGNYRILRGNPDGMEDEANTTAVDVADETSTPTYDIAYNSGNGTAQHYRDVTYAPYNMDEWCSQCHTRYGAGAGQGHIHSGDAVFSYRHNTQLSGGCLRCHVAHGTTATMGSYSGSVNLPDPLAIAGGAYDSRLLSARNRKVCTQCHQPTNGDVGHGGAGGGDCADCHGTSGSHSIHTTGDPRGPATPLDCNDCHDGNNYLQFTDGQPLATTTTCDTCHSPGGSYDGVNDPTIGAKTNWDSGVYGSPLQPGKEQWCVGCHDDDPAVIAGISAPDVSLFWTSGHGRSGTVDCEDCHDTATGTHIDGDARTYTFDTSYYSPSHSGVAYAAGYRLTYVSGEVPLMVPANYSTTFSYDAQTMKDNAFRLCFDSCHNPEYVLDTTPASLDTNFKATAPNPPRNYSYAWGSGADINEHVSHIMNYTMQTWDSDWDPSTNGPSPGNTDSMTACSTCHNVHGAAGYQAGWPNDVMIRDGSLAGRTGFGFSYVIQDTGAGGYPWVTSIGATKMNSTGAILRNSTETSSSDVMCTGSMCHGVAPQSSPSYDASGNAWGTYLEFYRPWQDVGPYGP